MRKDLNPLHRPIRDVIGHKSQSQIQKLQYYANKSPFDHLHVNLPRRELEPNDSDDSLDAEEKSELLAEKIRLTKPYRITYKQLQRKVRGRKMEEKRNKIKQILKEKEV